MKVFALSNIIYKVIMDFYCMEVTAWILLLQQKLQINGIYLREE